MLNPVPPEPPKFVLYIATGDDAGTGKVYQVDDDGRVLGVVKLPYAPTGMALHRTHGLVVALPRDGGKIMRIDESGKVSTLLEKNETIVHPVDVAIAGDSDSVVIADNIADVLATTTAGGGKPSIYQRFPGQKWVAQDMSVAVTNDKHVLLGTNSEKGIYRFSGDSQSANSKPLLPEAGGVAADPKSLRWAATQAPNQIYVFEGGEMMKKLRLPPNQSVYRQGLLSFGPAGSLCVATRKSDEAVGQPWLLMYDVEKENIRSLFQWKGEQMNDFVVGPRMLWNRNSPSTYKSVY
jgi:hypothetical protein